jgi:hypothetical protein
MFRLRCLGTAPFHGGPWPREVFEAAVLATLRLDQGHPFMLRRATARHTYLTPADCQAALRGVAAAETNQRRRVGAEPKLPRCEMNKCRWYHLNKALSVPQPKAPEVISRTQTSVKLLLHGHVSAACCNPVVAGFTTPLVAFALARIWCRALCLLLESCCCVWRRPCRVPVGCTVWP